MQCHSSAILALLQCVVSAVNEQSQQGMQNC